MSADTPDISRMTLVDDNTVTREVTPTAVYRTVRPVDQTMTNLRGDKFVANVHGVFQTRPGNEEVQYDHDDNTFQRMGCKGMSLSTEAGVGRPFRRRGDSVRPLQRLERLDTLARTLACDSVYFYSSNATDKQRDIKLLPEFAQVAARRAHVSIRGNLIQDAKRLDLSFVYRLPQDTQLPPGYSLMNDGDDHFTLCPPVHAKRASHGGLCSCDANQDLVLVLDDDITTLDWQYAGMIFFASGLLDVCTEREYDDSYRVALFLDAYASSMSTIEMHWAAVDYARYLSGLKNMDRCRRVDLQQIAAILISILDVCDWVELDEIQNLSDKVRRIRPLPPLGTRRLIVDVAC